MGEGSSEVPMELRGSALPCDLKAFQGSTQLQGGSWAGLGRQMVEEGETWVVGAKEHEN